jgi:hypothetical protein
MHARPFTLLYAICLVLCLGVIHMLEAYAQTEEAPVIEPQVVEGFMALPPRPQGMRDLEAGSGEGYSYTEKHCLELEGQSRDICFLQLARQRAETDLEGGVLACGQIGEQEMTYECLSDVGEQHALVDRGTALALCETIGKRKWRDQCVFGIALTLQPGDPVYAFRLCDQSGQWLDYCRHDVNGQIAETDLPHAMANCAAEEGDLLRRKSCWHGIGKYVGRIDTDQGFAACQQVPLGPQDLYRENCVHGVGWAGAEQLNAAFVSECDKAGNQRDSCLLGVAYNMKRLNPEEGLQICAKVGRGDLRQKCNQWVGG